MTVLQKIIDECIYGGNGCPPSDKYLLDYLKQYLPAEEQQIRDAWQGGYERCLHRNGYPQEPAPIDVGTYITNLKNQL